MGCSANGRLARLMYHHAPANKYMCREFGYLTDRLSQYPRFGIPGAGFSPVLSARVTQGQPGPQRNRASSSSSCKGQLLSGGADPGRDAVA